jgi:hypothetical protein
VKEEEGAPTQRAEFRQMARKLVYDPEYQKKLLKDFQARKISPAIERLFWEAAHCSVKVDEQGGEHEARRAQEMREVMGAKRVLRLRPHIPQEELHGDDPA